MWSNQNDNHTKNETSLENLKPAWFLNQFRQPFGMVQWAKRWRNFAAKFIMCYWFFFRNFKLRKTYFCDAGYNNKQTSVQNDGFYQNSTFSRFLKQCNPKPIWSARGWHQIKSLLSNSELNSRREKRKLP